MKYTFDFSIYAGEGNNHPRKNPTLSGRFMDENGQYQLDNAVYLKRQDHITMKRDPDGTIKEFHTPNKFLYVTKITQETIPEKEVSDFVWAIGEGILHACNHPSYQYLWKLDEVIWKYDVEEQAYEARLVFRILDRSTKKKETKPVGSNLYSVGDGGRRNFG